MHLDDWLTSQNLRQLSCSVRKSPLSTSDTVNVQGLFYHNSYTLPVQTKLFSIPSHLILTPNNVCNLKCSAEFSACLDVIQNSLHGNQILILSAFVLWARFCIHENYSQQPQMASTSGPKVGVIINDPLKWVPYIHALPCSASDNPINWTLDEQSKYLTGTLLSLYFDA